MLCRSSSNAVRSEEDLKDDVEEMLKYRFRLDRGCQLYTGHRLPDGGGWVCVGNERWRVSRVSAWLYKGLELHSERVAVHNAMCSGNPACFNPDHISIAENRIHATGFMVAMRDGGRGLDRLVCVQAATMSPREISRFQGRPLRDINMALRAG